MKKLLEENEPLTQKLHRPSGFQFNSIT